METYEENIFGDDFGQYVDGLDDNQEPSNDFEPADSQDFFGDGKPDEGQPEPSNDEKDDFITSLLKRNGINRHAIQVENEDGEIEEIDFDELTDDEKLALYDQANESAISDDELKTLNYLRDKQMSLEDMIKWQREEAVKEYLSQAQQPRYNVDNLSDDELYQFDLQDRYPEMTDEEITQELESAKTNEVLFKKKIDALRKEYKELEDEHNKAVKAKEDQEAEQQFNQLAESLVNVARNTNELHDLVLEDEDKEAVLSFLLDRDANGQSQFYKLFSDPEKMFEMAWYARFGKEAFQNINDYYKSVIEKTRRGDKPQTRTVRKQNNQKSASSDAFDLESQYRSI